MFTPTVIAKIKSPYSGKFGIPRQSGMVNCVSEVVFEKPYNNIDAVRGIEEFSHIWLIWYFDKSDDKVASLTVRPPKLGGNVRVGVFASRSPFRPNPIGLTLVKLVKVNAEGKKLSLTVEDADLLDGTPILDIKPYLPFSESLADAIGGFSETTSKVRLYVDFPDNLIKKIDEDKRLAVKNLLSLDPRPGYQNDAERIYGVTYYDYNIKFKTDGKTLYVTEVESV